MLGVGEVWSKKKINLVAIFVSRFLAEENFPKFGQTVLSNTAKFQVGQDSATCVLVQCPQLLQNGECQLSLTSSEGPHFALRRFGCGGGVCWLCIWWGRSYRSEENGNGEPAGD